MRLQGEVAVVTGAGRGIGRAIAVRCAEEGADVVLAARSADELDTVAAEVRALGRRALPIPTDVRSVDAVEAMAARALEEFGSVDILVANSGVGGPSAPLWQIAPEDWEATFAVNVTGTYLCCRAVLPAMIERGRGSIAIIGSMSGKRPLLHRSAYAASKMALVGLTRTLALEAGPYGVRINLLSPGAVEGDRMAWVLEQQAGARDITPGEVRREFEAEAPLRRLVQPGDVADAVVFLCSQEASAITGADLNVTSGVVTY
ncbi:MAG: SDR family oxidoreductase [Actinobacteria bacterium]|nr:SDR family oxidoreductase [Actinomycetota bacterium]